VGVKVLAGVLVDNKELAMDWIRAWVTDNTGEEVDVAGISTVLVGSGHTSGGSKEGTKVLDQRGGGLLVVEGTGVAGIRQARAQVARTGVITYEGHPVAVERAERGDGQADDGHGVAIPTRGELKELGARAELVGRDGDTLVE
jgi:hypothetical protein